MNVSRLRPLVIIFAIVMFGATTFGQTSQPDSTAQPQPTPTPSLEKRFLANILRDQRAIWTAPFSLQRGDARWLAPLGIATAVLLATDRHTSGELFVGANHRRRINISGDFSRLGTGYATGGVAAAFYFVGRAKHDARARETGVLSAEALIDSAIVVTALKTATQRQRPTMDHASGEFFEGGSSFPSGHAIAAWSVATVVASEYGRHRPLVRFGAYGIATVVSLARYTGTNHFLSDVLVGSALGYGIGRYVYKTHHDRSLDVDNGTIKKKTITQSKLFPRIAPSYSRRGHTYGATFAWSL
jgi:membrane-associated phospholipid phosphatase